MNIPTISTCTVTLNINIANIQSSPITLEVYPSIAPEKLDSMIFEISSSITLGDMNTDGLINILLILLLKH